MRVEIWSDVVCPWCYIGKARFEQALSAFEQRDGVEVVHKSFQLDPSTPKGQTETVSEMLRKKYGAQAAGAEQRVADLAQAEGLAYKIGRLSGNTFDIHRVLKLADSCGRQEQVLAGVYAAYFGEAQNVFDDDALVAVAVGAGLEEALVREVLADPSLYADAVRADVREASELGVRGVPFFVFDRKYAISGGQAAEVFARALDQAWGERPPAGEVCEPDGSCAV